MKCLRRWLEGNGVKFVKKHIDSIEEIEEKIIVNCTGLGARTLNEDNAMYPAQGHLIYLRNQVPPMNYMIVALLEEIVDESGNHIKRYFYIFPKNSTNISTNQDDVGVIGGTFILGANDAPNLREFDILLKNAHDFFNKSSLAVM